MLLAIDLIPYKVIILCPRNPLLVMKNTDFLGTSQVQFLSHMGIRYQLFEQSFFKTISPVVSVRLIQSLIFFVSPLYT